jgi:multiple sugar transport system substrate-binding protein
MARKILLIVVAAALALTLTVGGAAAAPSVRIVLSGWVSSPAETASLQQAVAAFEASHPTIDVDYQPLDDYQGTMESRFAAGDPPDVFYVDSSVAPEWIAKGFLQPLQGLATSSGFDTAHFFPVLRHAFEAPNGKPYGFPKDWSPLAMFTNDTLLARAGVAAPTTWAELRQDAIAIRSATGVTPICLSVDWARLLAFVEENGGSFLNDSQTDVTINSQAVRDAVDFYVGLVRDGLAALPDALGEGWCGQAFADGKVAFAFEGTWLLPVVDAADPRPDYSTHPMPSSVGRGNVAFTVAYSMSAASTHKQAAWELLSYLTGRQGMQIWTSGGVALPARDDVPTLPGRESFVGEAPISTVWSFPPGFSNVLNLANGELWSVFAGTQTSSGMLAEIEAAARAALGQS